MVRLFFVLICRFVLFPAYSYNKAKVGMFVTELTGAPIAIAIQCLWWFIDVNIGTRKLEGGVYLGQLTPRHNSLENTQVFLDDLNILQQTGLFYLLLCC